MNRSCRRTCFLGPLFLLFFSALVSISAQDWVSFEGKTLAGEKLQLAGILTVPKGDGPFSAVVMLCGCAGHGVFHCFDEEGMNKTFQGHRMAYNSEAAANAIQQTEEFLAKYLTLGH